MTTVVFNELIKFKELQACLKFFNIISKVILKVDIFNLICTSRKVKFLIENLFAIESAYIKGDSFYGVLIKSLTFNASMI